MSYDDLIKEIAYWDTVIRTLQRHPGNVEEEYIKAINARDELLTKAAALEAGSEGL